MRPESLKISWRSFAMHLHIGETGRAHHCALYRQRVPASSRSRPVSVARPFRHHFFPPTTRDEGLEIEVERLPGRRSLKIKLATLRTDVQFVIGCQTEYSDPPEEIQFTEQRCVLSISCYNIIIIVFYFRKLGHTNQSSDLSVITDWRTSITAALYTAIGVVAWISSLPNLYMGSSGTPPASRNKHQNGQWPISCQVVARLIGHCSFRCSFGCVLLLNQFIWKQCAVRQYHSDLSDQAALEIRVRIRVRLIRVALF